MYVGFTGVSIDHPLQQVLYNTNMLEMITWFLVYRFYSSKNSIFFYNTSHLVFSVRRVIKILFPFQTRTKVCTYFEWILGIKEDIYKISYTIILTYKTNLLFTCIEIQQMVKVLWKITEYWWKLSQWTEVFTVWRHQFGIEIFVLYISWTCKKQLTKNKYK